MTQAWSTALRRGAIPVGLGILCWIAAVWALEDLHPLLVGVGGILVALGLIVIIATGRTLSAEEKRIGPRV